MPIWIVLGVCAAVFVLCAAIAGARGAFDGGMAEREDDRPPAQRLPAEASAEDLDRLSFTPALWGYRPAEVDAVLATLRARLQAYEEQAGAREVSRTPADRSDARPADAALPQPGDSSAP
ncbi:DivIVA domain-containing protein [Brevibacterium album]|uniref:DivIVA domain-containing protein n=1 Tax=Brevibacterium album TaxID=417948 RepID=UPI0004007F69|nr:DivIVA domain-containing protein [Brevibacterium album]